MAERKNVIELVIESGNISHLKTFISRSRISSKLINDFTFMIVQECYKQKKDIFLDTIVDELCINGASMVGGDSYVYLLNNTRMTVEIAKWIISNKPKLTFYYLVDNMITFLYKEPNVKEFLILLRKATEEKSIEVFQGLIDECSEDIEEDILEQLKEFKKKYSNTVTKSYVVNFGLTRKLLEKYDDVDIDKELDEESIKEIFTSVISKDKEETADKFVDIIENKSEKEEEVKLDIDSNVLDEIKIKTTLDQSIRDKFGEEDTIEKIIQAFKNSTDENTIKLIHSINYSLLIDKIRNDLDFFRLLGPVNPRVDAKGTICEFFGGCRMLECCCYVQTETGDFPDDEFDVDWFTGYCSFCDIKISKRTYAVRRCVVGGGWEGCFCGFEHSIDSLFYKDIKDKEEQGDKDIDLTIEDKLIIMMMRNFKSDLERLGLQKEN